MNEPRLFDPATTSPPRCSSCGATDARACEHDRERDEGFVSPTRRRPRGCLKAYDPATAQIPF